ncbi:MAG TPA: hypothetical protein VGM01_05400, partial [Ktedonobacteraceae bacterium]
RLPSIGANLIKCPFIINCLPDPPLSGAAIHSGVGQASRKRKGFSFEAHQFMKFTSMRLPTALHAEMNAPLPGENDSPATFS